MEPDAAEEMETEQELLLEIPEVEGFLAEPAFNPKTGNETRLKDLTQNDYERVRKAIAKEWNTNLENEAVRVIPEEADKIRQQHPHRIMQGPLLHVAKPSDMSLRWMKIRF